MYKSRLDDELVIEQGDSVLVIDNNGKLKKLIMPEFRDQLVQTAGTEKVAEILKLFDPDAELETFERIEKDKLN